MGIGNFIDNFISGLAFGIAVNNPFYRGFGCCGGYGFGGGYSMNRVDFDTFANPFPNVFGNMSYIPSIQQDSIFDGFANPAPTIDFSQTMQNIWNDTFNPDSDFNKRMKEYFDNQGKSNTTTNYNYQTSIQGYDVPFSQFYLPNQISYYGGYPQFQFDMFTPSTLKANQENETPAKQVAAQQNNTVTSKKTTRAADITTVTDTRTTTTNTNTSTTASVSLEPDKTDAEQIKEKPVNYDITALKNKWSKRKNLPDAFYEKVIRISKKIKCNPNDLMGVMWVESGHTFSPSAKNPYSSATGLIQFTTGTAQQLGTSIKKLRTMTAVEQLDYVEKYLVANKAAAGYKENETLNRGTLYSLVFLPGRSKRDVLTSRGENYYNQNKVLDYNKDGKITKADLHSVITDNLA